MKKLLSLIVLITCCCLLFVGCVAKENEKITDGTNENSNATQTESTVTPQAPMPQKHTVSLTIANYSMYIETSLAEYSTAAGQSRVRFTANGCLSYAYYDNVVFEIEHTGKKMLVACNVAGNGSNNYDGRVIGTITAVSGTVIYWM